MSMRIDDYLDELKRALEGADRATVQDALADAEEHLRTALDAALRDHPERSENQVLEEIMEQYGTPEETASAYMEIEERTEPAMSAIAAKPRSPAGRIFGALIDPRAYGALFYMFFAMITGIIYFTWATAGLSMSAGFIVLIFGIPFFGLFLLSVQGLALVEGRIIEALLGVRMPRRPIFSRRDLGAWGKFKSLVRDRRTWLTLLYMVILMPLGILYFTIFITLVILALYGIMSPALMLWFGWPAATIHGVDYYLPGWYAPLTFLAGILLLLLTLHLAKGMGFLHGKLAKKMLVKD
jgi:uncharacterized membrane protein